MLYLSTTFDRAGLSKTILLSLLLVAALLAFGPTGADADYARVSFQGKLTNSSGQPVSDGSYDMVFKFYTAATGGTLLLTDRHVSGIGQVEVRSGLYTAFLGGGEIVPGSWTTLWEVFQNNQEVYLGVTVGTDAEMTPRLLLTRAPYAVRAASADDSAALAGLPAASFLDVTSTPQTKSGRLTLTAQLAATPMLELINTSTSGQGLKATIQSGYPAVWAVNKGSGPIIKGYSGAVGTTTVFEVKNNGDVAIPSTANYTFSPAKTARVTFSPADFGSRAWATTASNDYIKWGLDDWKPSTFYLQATQPDERAFFHAPVHLPTGANIAKLIVNYRDTCLERTSTIKLSKCDVRGPGQPGVPAAETLALIDTVDNVAHLETPAFDVVDNMDYYYVVTVKLWEPGGAPAPPASGAEMVLYSVQIEYTYSALSN